MIYPNFNEEKKLWKKGSKIVVGLDEAGRGPLAGPVVAGAVFIFKKDFSEIKKIKSVRDSKKLSGKKRKEVYDILINNPRIKWGIGVVSEKVIDKINIFEANKLAMKKAIKSLKKKPDFLVLDGNFKIDVPFNQKSIIKADKKVFSCSIASIIAKVTRDRIMERYHKKYPLYKFNRHKGYPTKLHFKLLKKHGPCKIHRKSFGPVRLAK